MHLGPGVRPRFWRSPPSDLLRRFCKKSGTTAGVGFADTQVALELPIPGSAILPVKARDQSMRYLTVRLRPDSSALGSEQSPQGPDQRAQQTLPSSPRLDFLTHFFGGHRRLGLQR